MTSAVTVDPNVTLTIAAGTTVTVTSGVSFTINGTLDIEGTTGTGVVTIQPASGATSFGGFDLGPNSALIMKYATVTGASVNLVATSTATFRDSHLSESPGDLLVMNGGTVDMQYSWIGTAATTPNSTHCDMHFGGDGDVIKVSHTNVSMAAYGLMFYSGNSADFTYDNWYSNTYDVSTEQGTPVSGDFSYGYFMTAAPTGTGITATNLMTAMLLPCDGTNDTTCAGQHP